MLEPLYLVGIGLCVGMVVNYLADILPANRRFVAPHCLICSSKQSYFNYLFWPRRCQECGTRRPIRTWLIELIFVGVSLWLWSSPPDRLGFAPSLILLSYFGIVAVIDIEHRLILNMVSLAGAGLGLGIGIWSHGVATTLVGGVAGFAIMLVLYLLGAVLMGWLARSRGRTLDEDALGFGDVNLGGVLGLILGWPGILLGLVLAIMVLILLSCLGGEEFRLREVAVLLLALAGLAVGIFFYGLQMPFKVWPL